MDQLHTDTRGIFPSAELPAAPSLNKTEASLRVAEDRLILAGTRAGTFEIGTTWAALHSKIQGAKPKRAADPRYAFVLPLGYVPERDFVQVAALRILLAFSTVDRTLFEIFVRDPAYSTPEGIRVGTPSSSLRRVSGLTRRHTKDTDYFQGEGITFLVSKGTVMEIAVVRRVQK